MNLPIISIIFLIISICAIIIALITTGIYLGATYPRLVKWLKKH